MITNAFKRFKLAFLFYLISGICGAWLVIANRFDGFPYKEVSLLCLLFTLGTIAAVFSFYLESNSKKPSKIETLLLISSFLYTIGFFYFSNSPYLPFSAALIQCSLLCIGIGACKDSNGFESNDFGYYVITRLFVLGLCLSILCLGVVFLDSQITHLFGKEFLEEFRKHFCPAFTNIAIYSLFPIVFLSLIPNDKKPYPNLFAKFIEYTAIPLFAIALLELCVYAYKVFETFKGLGINNVNLQNLKTIPYHVGMASALTVLCGISFLLISFFRKNINRYLYVATLVIIQVFFCCFIIPKINSHINQFGIDETTYMPCVFGLILFTSTFFNKKHIINIVGVFLLIAFFSPLNMHTTSTFFQTKRLEELLIKEKILVNGKIKPLTFPETRTIKDPHKIINGQLIQPPSHHEIKRIIRYLCNKQEFEFMKPWFSDFKDASIHKYKYTRSFIKPRVQFPNEVGNHSMCDLTYKTFQDLGLEPKYVKKLTKSPL